MVRFQADANLNQIIVATLLRRAPDVDFHSAPMAGLAGLADSEVLAHAAREGRVLVTHDSKTMPRHFAQFETVRWFHSMAVRRADRCVICRPPWPRHRGIVSTGGTRGAGGRG